MGQVTRGYAAAATALLLLSGASSFGECWTISFSCRWQIIGISLRKEELCQATSNERLQIEMRDGKSILFH
jgi:hypothetical protein